MDLPTALRAAAGIDYFAALELLPSQIDASVTATAMDDERTKQALAQFETGWTALTLGSRNEVPPP